MSNEQLQEFVVTEETGPLDPNKPDELGGLPKGRYTIINDCRMLGNPDTTKDRPITLVVNQDGKVWSVYFAQEGQLILVRATVYDKFKAQ
jgi:hypothetical protein